MEFLWNGPPYQGSQSYRRKRKTSAPYQDQSEIFSATSKTNSTDFPKSTRTIFGERSFTKPGSVRTLAYTKDLRWALRLTKIWNRPKTWSDPPQKAGLNGTLVPRMF